MSIKHMPDLKTYELLLMYQMHEPFICYICMSGMAIDTGILIIDLTQHYVNHFRLLTLIQHFCGV